jgi:hypothetical protein
MVTCPSRSESVVDVRVMVAPQARTPRLKEPLAGVDGVGTGLPERGSSMAFGPVQVVVIGFSDAAFPGAVLPELRRLRGQGAIRLIDVTFVSKDDDGRLTMVEPGDLGEEWSGFGEIGGALSGCGGGRNEGLTVGAQAGAANGSGGSAAGEAWAITDAIPPGILAAVVVIEHHWAIPLSRAIGCGGGFALEDTWLHPADLIAVGAARGDES